jgi:hypothetical protein
MLQRQYVVWRVDAVKTVTLPEAMETAASAVRCGRERAYVLEVVGHTQRQQPVVEFVPFQPEDEI